MIEKKAIVIDNNDEDKKDRLKVRIIPDMIDVDEKLLPWVLPKTGYGNKDSISRRIPEKESIIFIETDEYYNKRNMRWKYDCSVIASIDFDNVKDAVDSIDDKVSDYTYPQPNEFIKYKDGSFSFRNTETGEFVFCHNSGVYTIYDEDGNIKHYTKDKLFQIYNDKLNLQLKDNGDFVFENEQVTTEYLNDGNVNIENGTCKINMSTSSVKINDNFEVLT